MLKRKYDDIMTMHAINDHDAIALYMEDKYDSIDNDFDAELVFLKKESDDISVTVPKKDWENIHIFFLDVITGTYKFYAGSYLEASSQE